jgi:hypothetical protein
MATEILARSLLIAMGGVAAIIGILWRRLLSPETLTAFSTLAFLPW